MKEYLTAIYFIGRLKGQADIAQSWQHHWKEFEKIYRTPNEPS
jgi:hypothetical protein